MQPLSRLATPSCGAGLPAVRQRRGSAGAGGAGAVLTAGRLFEPDHRRAPRPAAARSEEHTSELQSPCNLVCRLLLEKKKKKQRTYRYHQHPILSRPYRSVTPSVPILLL